MRILAIDTALSACSAAVFDNQAGILASESLPMVRGHAEALMPLVDRLAHKSNLAFSSLDRIVATVGPGSFTGLRVGVAAARAIALATGKSAVGVTTLAALAAPHLARNDGIPVLAVIDARNQQVYVQLFNADGRPAGQARIAALAEAILYATYMPVCITGSGARLIVSAWPNARPQPALVDQREAPDIEWVARLGTSADAGAAPKPLYLRPPDARRQEWQLPRR